VPTIADAGVQGYEVKSWVGILAPKGTPAPVVQALNTAIAEALATRDAVELIKLQGARVTTTTPGQFAALIANDRKMWHSVVTMAGVLP